jgi:DNA (cytosine-5)-methyltransferase 1
VALRGREGGATAELSDVPSALRASTGGGDKAHVLASSVRRLTPRECERLQGFPDDYTLITYRGKPAADGPRYKSLGNSMAVPVMRWILLRIQKISVAVQK